MHVLLLCITLLVTDVFAGPTSWQRILTRATSDGNIVGGEARTEEVSPATPGERPFQVNIQPTTWGVGEHFCGGAIYSASVIITSATCIGHYVDRPEDLQIVSGDYRMSLHEGYEQVIQVSQVKSHPSYSIFTMEDNIALLKLSAPLEFNKYTQPIALPPNSGFPASGKCTKSGWGSSGLDEENYSDIMQQINIRVLATEDCYDALDSMGLSDMDTIICAGFRENEMSTCIGDDGGPLTCLHNDEPYLAGILSFDLNCSHTYYPGVYTAVENYITWIKINAYFMMISS